MKKWLFTILLGIMAGILDIIPMILQNLDMHSILSAFTQWVILGVIINYIAIKIPGWLKGMLIAEALAIPVMILVAKTEVGSLPPMIIMSLILGGLVGFIGEKFAR